MWGTLGGFTHRQGGLLQTTSAGLEGGGMFNDMVAFCFCSHLFCNYHECHAWWPHSNPCNIIYFIFFNFFLVLSVKIQTNKILVIIVG